MMEDKDPLEQIIGNLNVALDKTAKSGDHFHREYAAKLSLFTTKYMSSVVKGQPRHLLKWRGDPKQVISLSEMAVMASKSDQWRTALERTHLTLSTLPGEPGGVPITPPPLPW
jgi:hypothetical protein